MGRTFILGDYHGNTLQPFREAVDVDEIDLLMSTGDFDQVETINEFLDLREEVGEENVVDVGGNHDHAVLNRRGINSSSIFDQAKTFQEMVHEVHEDSERSRRARNYLEKLMEYKTQEFEIGGKSGILVHGGIAGYLQDPDRLESDKELWYRLWNEEDFEDTFGLMEERDAELLVRGHDHWTEHAYRQNGEIEYDLPEPGEEYSIEDGMHIITHGPWEERMFATIRETEDDTILQYHQI